MVVRCIFISVLGHFGNQLNRQAVLGIYRRNRTELEVLMSDE